MAKKPTLRSCVNGHQYYKSSDCPVCPICEKKKIQQSEFLGKIGAPARRAMEEQGIQKLEQVAKFSEKELLALHGVGPNAVGRLKNFLKEQGLHLRKD